MLTAARVSFGVTLNPLNGCGKSPTTERKGDLLGPTTELDEFGWISSTDLPGSGRSQQPLDLHDLGNQTGQGYEAAVAEG